MMLVAETGEGQIINIMEETRTDLERRRTQSCFVRPVIKRSL